MKLAIKALFEQAKGQITKFNIEATILIAAMTDLVNDYIAEGKLELAFEAAKVTGNPATQRLVFDASRNITPHSERVGMGGFMEVYEQKSFLFEILMAVGTEKELRDAAKAFEAKGYLEVENVIKIYTQLKDTAALMRAGKKAAKSYFDTLDKEKETHTYCSGTPSIPHYALEVFEAAKKLGAKGVDKELILFGDKLFATHKEFEVLDHSGSSGDRKVPEAIRAYELTGTIIGLKKAAEGYLTIDNLASAARCFSKLHDESRVRELVQTIAQKGKLLEATMLRAELLKEAITSEELEKLVGTTAEVAKTKVVSMVNKYLDAKASDEPFPTSHTFWHYSESNLDEWKEYLHNVHTMASRTDTYFCRPFVSIAKELYATNNAPMIGQIHLALQKHLIVGYLLSAIAMEVDGRCPDRRGNRKYAHAFDAAWRTFAHGIDPGGYNPFDSDLGLKDDPDMKPLFEEVHAFAKSQHALCRENKDTWESDEFIRKGSPELQKKVRTVYQKLTGDIRNMLTQLK